MGKRVLPATLCLAFSLAAAAPVAGQDEPEVITDFGSIVGVVDPATPGFPAASIMRADCAFLVRVEAPDGSATEWQACMLSDEPVMIPERQGSPPDEALVYGGGECTWSSDYWFLQAESDIKASAFEVTVTPSGHVYAWSTYPAEPLACPEG